MGRLMYIIHLLIIAAVIGGCFRLLSGGEDLGDFVSDRASKTIDFYKKNLTKP